MTTDPSFRSFIVTARQSHFPIQNLPYGVFRPARGGDPHVGVAIGQFVLDLAVLQEHGLLPSGGSSDGSIFHQSSLNQLLQLDGESWHEIRATISHLLQDDVTTLRDDLDLRTKALIPIRDVQLLLPVRIGDYTDFYSSRYHATNVGRMLRPDEPLNPNWVHMPVAYHGRASSVVVSGTDPRRPCGQRPGSVAGPTLGPSQLVDFELEVGFIVGGKGNDLGRPVSIGDAMQHVFGLVLVNDWSARDIQRWEYTPLGPFLAKSFATSISPWVVPVAALEPFRTEGPIQDPAPLPYLRTDGNPTYDLQLEAWLTTAKSDKAQRICASNLRHVYWNVRQQIAHHTVAGCNLRPGDLLATGTASGPDSESQACLLERTSGGREPLALDHGESRRFLEDGDRVSMTGWCQGDGYRVGFGEVTGQLLPAHHAALGSHTHGW